MHRERRRESMSVIRASEAARSILGAVLRCSREKIFRLSTSMRWVCAETSPLPSQVIFQPVVITARIFACDQKTPVKWAFLQHRSTGGEGGHSASSCSRDRGEGQA